jgi:hypothetical protein
MDTPLQAEASLQLTLTPKVLISFILAYRPRRQGLRALWALAAVQPSLNL